MEFYSISRFYIKQFFGSLFDKKIRYQNRFYKSIPIFIISFNQLDTLKKLIAILNRKGYFNIIIIDNNSTYPPLLEFFSNIEARIPIFRLKENLGHRVFWKKKEMFKDYTNGYYAITDPDVLPDDNCPDDFLLQFKKILDKNPKIDKVGFSLRIDSIPNYNPNKEKIIKWEKRYWNRKEKAGNYIADIDTTFALYRPGGPFVSYKGIRTKYPYMANHLGWDIDPNGLTKEQQFYKRSSNSSSSWKVNDDGALINKNYE